MAQISIREYDVKTMLYRFLGKSYSGVQMLSIDDIDKLDVSKKYVIKPDMLFGKRGKRGLLGLNYTVEECNTWLQAHLHKEQNIDGIDGNLDVFMAEEFVKPVEEYYLCFSLDASGDTITYCSEGGIDIEENWEKTSQVSIPVQEDLSEEQITSLGVGNPDLITLLKKLWDFYRSHGFVSLEFNPIAKDKDGKLCLLDAVAKVDDCEFYRQKHNWRDLDFPNTYGFKENDAEKYIRELDSVTGASLKMKILNPNAKIWTLFAGGGGSLVMTDTLGYLGYADEIGNYGECSGNPSREFTYEYSKMLLTEMLKNKHIGKYLIIAGAIANFTHIDTTFSGIIDALEELQDKLRAQKVEVLVRRGGINEKVGLDYLSSACKKLQIPATITGSDTYMTDILRKIEL